MNKTIIFLLLFGFSFSMHAQQKSERIIKVRKLSFDDFMDDYAIDDTARSVIELFFDKKTNSAYGQMSFFPITLGLAFIPPTAVIGAGLTLISFPMFINGSYIMVKYRKAKLLKVLKAYKTSKKLPNWVSKKVYRILNNYKQMEVDY